MWADLPSLAPVAADAFDNTLNPFAFDALLVLVVLKDHLGADHKLAGPVACGTALGTIGAVFCFDGPAVTRVAGAGHARAAIRAALDAGEFA